MLYKSFVLVLELKGVFIGHCMGNSLGAVEGQEGEEVYIETCIFGHVNVGEHTRVLEETAYRGQNEPE